MKTRLKLAIPDQSFRTVKVWERALDIMVALEVEAVDVCLMDGRSHFSTAELLADGPAFAARISKAVGARGLVVSSIDVVPEGEEIEGRPGAGYATTAPNHPDADERARSERLFNAGLELASRVGAPTLTMLPGVDFPEESHEDSLARAATSIAARTETARAEGVGYSAEAHVGSVLEDPTDALRLCEEAQGVKLTVDYTNFTYAGYDDDEIEPLLPHAQHVHARGGAEGLAQTRLEDSTTDVARMGRALLDLDYDGFVRLEFVWRDDEPYLADVDVVTEIGLIRDLLRGL